MLGAGCPRVIWGTLQGEVLARQLTSKAPGALCLEESSVVTYAQHRCCHIGTSHSFEPLPPPRLSVLPKASAFIGSIRYRCHVSLGSRAVHV